MQRREFLKYGALFAGAMTLDIGAFARAAAELGMPRLRVGILSDIHIKTEADIPLLERTFRYFRSRNVDAVLIAGDMADSGLEKQMRPISECWFNVFPRDRGVDGKKVERLFIYGNHDMEGQTYAIGDDVLAAEDRETMVKREEIRPRKEKLWKKYWKEDFQPIYIKEVKGYKFVGAHWTNWQNTPDLKEFLAEHDAELKGEKPFFYFQHPHPKGTTGGPWVWGQDNGEVTAILSGYPNCVCFSGHSHQALNDEHVMWQGAFTSIGTASLSYTTLTGGRENTVIWDGASYPSEMPQMDMQQGRQGMVMSVYDDTICLERRDFLYEKPMDGNWIIPLGAAGHPCSYQERAAAEAAPQFAEGDAVKVSRSDADGGKSLVSVHFPNVLKRTCGVRAYDFEVTLEHRREDIILVSGQKRVFSPHRMNCEEQDTGEVTCVFAFDDIPHNFPCRFAVRPCGCFGAKGEPIYTEWQKFE